MKFNDKELSSMTKNELIKHITDLYINLEEQEKISKNKGSIHFGGSPKWTKDYYDKVMQELKEVRNE